MAKTKNANGNEREKPGAAGEGGFYHIEVKSPEEFKRFRTQDFSKKGGIERVGGQREDGYWETVKWLIAKGLAHIEDGELIADDKEVHELFDKLDAVPKQIEGDRFEAIA